METGSVKTLLDERGRLSKPFFLVFLVSSFSIVLSSCNTTSAGFDYEPTRARFVLETDGNGTLVTLPVSNVRIPVNSTAIITEYDLEDVSLAELEMGTCLRFTTTRRASRVLYQESASNQGKRMVLLVNGRPLGIQRIERPIADGVFHIFVELPDSELPELARNLKGTSLDIQAKLNR